MKTLILAVCFCLIGSVCFAQGSTGSAPVQSYGSTGSAYAAGSYGSTGSSVAMKSGGSSGYAASSYGAPAGRMTYAELERHLRVDHRVNTRGMSYAELEAEHTRRHAVGDQPRRRFFFRR